MITPRFKWVETRTNQPARCDLVIVGGGFSGSLLAVQLLRREPDLAIAIVDSGKVLGRGLAYRTNYLCHVLNVPAKNMSAFPDDSEHFLRWVRRNHDLNAQPTDFLPRGVYGRYLDSLLKEAATRSGRDLPWFRDQALSLARSGDDFSLQLKSGREIRAKVAVIATGNVPPGDPIVPGLTDSAERYIPFSWTETALDGMRGASEVLLIGAGLTGIDLALALASKGFQGKIHMLSRRGLLPQPHRFSKPWQKFWGADSPRTARGLTRLIRDQVRLAAGAGIDWRSVIDTLRPATAEIWRSLPYDERRRFMRHVRAYWEAHRHRVAPEVAERLTSLMDAGRIELHAGRVVRYREEPEFAAVAFRRRRDGQMKELRVGRVINCTGPEADWRRIDNGLLSSLFVQGLARPDALFLGLDVDENGCVLNDQGETSNTLFAIGPVRKGCLWETTAVPELRQQASALAAHIARVLCGVPRRETDSAALRESEV